MKTIAERLVNSMGPMIKSLYAFFSLLFISEIIIGISNSILAKLVNEDPWLELSNTKDLRDVEISLAVMGFCAFFFSFFLFVILYICGYAFLMHTIFMVTALACIACSLILLCFSIYYTTNSKKIEYTEDFIYRLAKYWPPRNEVLTNWIEKVKCDSFENCSKEAKEYVEKRTIRVLVMNCVNLVLFGGTVISLITIAILMSLMKPVEENTEDESEQAPLPDDGNTTDAAKTQARRQSTA